ncbi:hypothetical protein CapIbe_021657 [Capra ibex]
MTLCNDASESAAPPDQGALKRGHAHPRSTLSSPVHLRDSYLSAKPSRGPAQLLGTACDPPMKPDPLDPTGPGAVVEHSPGPCPSAESSQQHHPDTE